MKNILMVLAKNNFRDTEYVTPRAFFEANKANVMTTSASIISCGRFGFKVKNDFLLKEINPAEFSGIFIVGGGGILDFLENEDLKKVVLDFIDLQKVVGAICAAPRLLLNWEVLRNKNFTGWNGDQVLANWGEKISAKFTNKSVEVDGKVLTANGPNAVEEAALKFLEIL